MIRNLIRKPMVVAAALAAIGGCSSVAIVDPLKSDGRITTTAANALFSDEYTPLDLVQSLDPENKRRSGGCSASASVPTSATSTSGDEFGAAMRAFYCYANPELRRNRLQDELIWRSENRCVIYKNYLKRVESMQGTYTGIISTVLSGVGAITKDIGRAQLHSALSAISSGTGAELKQGFFSDVAVSVLVPGIDERRRQLLGAIQARRNGGTSAPLGGASIGAYTMEAALRDVAEYHGACSILVGLDVAKDAIREVKNPGLQSLTQAFAAQRLIAKVADPKSSTDDIETARSQLLSLGLNPLGAIGIGKAGTALPDAGSATGFWWQAQAASLGAIAALEDRVSELARDASTPDDAKTELAKLPNKSKVTDAGGSASGCGTGWLRSQVNAQFSSKLTDAATRDRDILAAQQKVRLATDDPARIREQAIYEDAQAKALEETAVIKRYMQLVSDGVRKAASRIGGDAKTLTAAVVDAVAKDLETVGQLAIASGDKVNPAAVCN